MLREPWVKVFSSGVNLRPAPLMVAIDSAWLMGTGYVVAPSYEVEYRSVR